MVFFRDEKPSPLEVKKKKMEKKKAIIALVVAAAVIVSGVALAIGTTSDDGANSNIKIAYINLSYIDNTVQVGLYNVANETNETANLTIWHRAVVIANYTATIMPNGTVNYVVTNETDLFGRFSMMVESPIGSGNFSSTIPVCSGIKSCPPGKRPST